MGVQMSPEMAQAASEHARHAELMARAKLQGISPGRLIAREAREQIDRKPRREGESLPGRVWRAMDVSVRTVLVMLASEQQGAPDKLARQPWESFSDHDQAEMAATARMLRGELRDAGALW